MNSYFECGTCTRAFPAGWKARDQHLDATGHRSPEFECDTCYRFFNSDQARWQHMNAVNHFKHECLICKETWPTEEQLTRHEQEDHHYCKECQKRFQNSNAIKMHLNSRFHRRQQIQCPFCKRTFVSATGLTHHVERGSCPKATDLNRDTLYKFVRAKDPNGAITNNLIGWHGSTQYEANGLAYNQSCQAWECYLCNRLFNSLQGLNQHLNSPVRTYYLLSFASKSDLTTTCS